MKSILKITVLSCLIILFGFNVQAQKKSKKDSNKDEGIRLIQADFNQPQGPSSKVWQKCIGAGRANEGLRAEWQKQLIKVKNECGFDYIRMHGLLHDDMGVYFEDEDGNPEYSWMAIDMLYDFLLSIDIKPFVELSFMPSALASGEETIFWWEGNITPPESYEKWYELIKSLVQHLENRYGEEEVKTWYFEVWNEPNLSFFFSGSQEEYFELYKYSAKAVKDVNPAYRIGGPATAGNAWVPEIIEYCTNHNVALDFISTHSYGVVSGFFDHSGNAGTLLNPDPKAISNDVARVRKQIKSSSKPDLELHYTEWSSSYTPTDHVHDSYHSTAFILDKIKGTEKTAHSMSYWIFSDVFFEESGPAYKPFHGGFGLLNFQGIEKPAYFSYKFLSRLGNTELINSDSASWVCKNEEGDIQVLLWDFTLTHPEDSVNNQVYYKRELPPGEKGKVRLSLSNIPRGNYQLKITKVGYNSNDPYTSYLHMGAPHHLNVKQIESLKESTAAIPYIQKPLQIKDDGSFYYEADLRENDCYLIELIKL